MSNWNTIHVFGYGESQIIYQATDRKVDNDKLTTIKPLFSYLSTLQKEGVIVSKDTLHSINIYNGIFIDFHSNSKVSTSQRFVWEVINSKLIKILVEEIEGKLLNINLEEKSNNKKFAVHSTSEDLVKKFSDPTYKK